VKPYALVATLAALAFAAPVAWLLATSIPATSQRPLGSHALGASSFPVEVPEIRYLHVRGGPTVHRVRFIAPKIDELTKHQQVRLLVGTYDTKPSLDRGELVVAGTDCVYRTMPGARFPNNELLTFVRSAGCVPGRGAPTGELRLVLQFDEPGRAALWADGPPAAGIPEHALVIADRSVAETDRRPLVRGFLVDVYPANRLSRVKLLAYVWHVSPSARWIWMAVAGSTALLWIGVFLLSVRAGLVPARGRVVACRMAGGFCAAAALSLAYGVIVPPFQAADEPNHFVGFAAFIHRAGMDVEAGQWARLGHFERIQFRPDEHFGPGDMEAPGIPWDDGTVPDASMRGAAVEWLWRAVPSLVRVLPAPKLLLALRLIDAVVFSTAVALFFGIVTAAGHGRWPELLAIPIFLVPTLPFFATTVSNYGLLVSAYVVLAAGIVLDLRDRDGAAAAGPIIGAAWMAAALTSRSSLPLAPFVAAWLIGRLVVGHRVNPWRSAVIYWVGATAFLGAGVWLANQDYLRTVSGVARQTLPWPIAPVLLAVVARPWLLIAAGLAAAGLEYRLSSTLRRMSGSSGRALILRAATATGLLVLVMLAGSAVLHYPTLPAIETASPPRPAVYVRSVMAAGATMFRVAHPDLLTSVSFWGGFGWLDTLLPPAFVSALACASGLAFAALMFVLARAGSVRALTRVGLAILGYAASLAAYALSVIVITPADLHGRYLIGLYLCMLAIAWSSVELFVEGAPAQRADAVRIGCGAAFVAVHVFSLGVILKRYF
jgi:hypothetical protein